MRGCGRFCSASPTGPRALFLASAGQALNGLKTGRLRVLCATDVAARGLDIKGVGLVVNFDVANNTEDHVHRIGRTGRAGATGYAVTFVSSDDAGKVPGIIKVMQETGHIGAAPRSFSSHTHTASSTASPHLGIGAPVLVMRAQPCVRSGSPQSSLPAALALSAAAHTTSRGIVGHDSMRCWELERSARRGRSQSVLTFVEGLAMFGSPGAHTAELDFRLFR